ncbi:MAG: tRNA (adenosine(37)-N6)-threonylcarbamoyltransferase complex dimerization subunit type 1 TsaB, partial [Candidatus Hydrothermae bacterium]|nr:tRNA (adenosine(37)-N6)-threonylcarbamoyltransferase complex dimerization subunit type 1 TsaB [Candidatus Hydrothermae bacterium]
MKVMLAVEASGPHTEVAVYDERGQLLHEMAHRVAFQHSRVLPWMLESVLRAVDARWQDVAWVAWDQGPGYFTALRVSLAVLKALGVAHGTLVIPVDAERAFVAGMPLADGQRVAVGLDAQKQELHVAILEAGDPPRVRFPMQRLPREEVEHLLEQQPVDVLVGSGMMRYFPDHPALWPEPLLQPSARGVGRLAFRLLMEGEVRQVHPQDLEPRYGRLPDALVY